MRRRDRQRKNIGRGDAAAAALSPPPAPARARNGAVRRASAANAHRSPVANDIGRACSDACPVPLNLRPVLNRGDNPGRGTLDS